MTSSAPTTPQPIVKTINVTTEFMDRSNSTLDQLPESPSHSQSVSVRSAPDTSHTDDYYEDILATISNTELVNRSSPILQPISNPIFEAAQSDIQKANKKATKKSRRRGHKKTASLSSAEHHTRALTPNGTTSNKHKSLKKKRLKVKPLKKTHKTVGFADDDEHKQRRRKGRHKKRKSLIVGKDLEKHLSNINQYLLPVPRKQAYYKWAILDPSGLKSKCKKSGTMQELLESLNINIKASTANISLVQSSDLLICLSNVCSGATVMVRTHCSHATESIKGYFREHHNIPIPIRSYETQLDEISLSHLLSSAREQKFLKAHRSRSNLNNHRIHGISRKMKTNSRFELDLTHKETQKLIDRLQDADDEDIDWAIFHFKDYKKNRKYLVISADECGCGGSEALSSKLAEIEEMRYAVLVVVYGHIVKKRLTLLIIWNPMNAILKNKIRNGDNNNNNRIRERAHSHSSTITFWQHKAKIKQFARAKKEMNINLHSKLAESMIISSLHRDGLIDDIIIRVTQTQIINDCENPIKPTAVPRQWKLCELKAKLSRDYAISLDNIRISLVPNIINAKHGKQRARTRTRTQSEIGWLLDDDKTLFDLGIDHGSQIYIHDIGNMNANSDDLNITNAKIKRDRLRNLEFIFNRNTAAAGEKILHRREQSMPNVHLQHFATTLKNTNHSKKTSTPKLSLSVKQLKKRKKKKHKKKKLKKKKLKTNFTDLLLPKTSSSIAKDTKSAISVGFLPEIRESITASTPPINHALGPISKSLSIPKYVQNIHESVSSVTTDEDSPSPRYRNNYNEAFIKAASAPAPQAAAVIIAPIAAAPIPAPAPIPLKMIGGSLITAQQQQRVSLDSGFSPLPPNISAVASEPVAPPIISNNNKRKKRKLKTRLDELQQEIDAKKAEEERERKEELEENEDDLHPSQVFTDLEIAQAKLCESSPLLVNRRSFELIANEEEIIPLPDTILMSDSNLVQTETNLDLNDIFITTHNIGRGKTASVHQALYKNTVFVAVKEFVFQNLSPAILADFHKEASTLKNLRHPNIAQLVGSYLDEVSGELYIVLEWLPNGCLHDLLHRKDEESLFDIHYYDVLLMAIDIARGMKYLHCKNIIHRDLKTHNLLLDEEYRVKVTDFGTAKHLEQVKSKAFTEVGTLGYVAPEVLDPPANGYDGKVDVFSYGVILWEIYSSFSMQTETESAKNVLTTVSTLQYAKQLKNGFRPKIPKDCPHDFKFLINQCWEYKPQKRPTFQQIVLYLQEIIKKYQTQNNINTFYNNGGNHDDDDDEDDDDDDNDNDFLYDDDDDDEYYYSDDQEEEEDYEEYTDDDDDDDD